jgi:hypothetical protein
MADPPTARPMDSRNSLRVRLLAIRSPRCLQCHDILIDP